MAFPIGLLGVATYLPPETRSNAWWPTATVERWQRARLAAGPPPPLGELSATMTRVLAALTAEAADPFHGVTQRHVMPAGMTALDMETHAAERAIAHAQRHAGFSRDAIDAVLGHTAVPEYLMSNPAAVLHRALGLARRCLALQVDASSYSFVAQLALAEQMIASGRARHVLIVQSTAASRMIDPEAPLAPMFGDGASAAIVGRVSDGGLIATVHHSNGSYPRALIASVPGGRWYDDGRTVLHSADPGHAREVFLRNLDFAVDVVGDVLREAGMAPGEIEFFAAHQGAPWLRRVTQEALGLAQARSLDTFETTGHLLSVSVPLVLETAQQRGLFARGDRVLLYAGGNGPTYGASVLRWGDPVA